MTFRSRALLNLSKGETCVRCGIQRPTVIGAHYTGVRRLSYGGGLGIKVHDCLVADLCADCHSYMDTLSRDKEGRWGHSEEFQHYVLLTLAKRFEKGQIAIWNTKAGKFDRSLTEALVVPTGEQR